MYVTVALVKEFFFGLLGNDSRNGAGNAPCGWCMMRLFKSGVGTEGAVLPMAYA